MHIEAKWMIKTMSVFLENAVVGNVEIRLLCCRLPFSFPFPMVAEICSTWYVTIWVQLFTFTYPTTYSSILVSLSAHSKWFRIETVVCLFIDNTLTHTHIHTRSYSLALKTFRLLIWFLGGMPPRLIAPFSVYISSLSIWAIANNPGFGICRKRESMNILSTCHDWNLPHWWRDFCWEMVIVTWHEWKLKHFKWFE